MKPLRIFFAQRFCFGLRGSQQKHDKRPRHKTSAVQGVGKRVER